MVGDRGWSSVLAYMIRIHEAFGWSLSTIDTQREGDDKMGLMEGDLTFGDEIGTIIKYV